jgi:protein associated with RNAse G/E
MGKGNFMKKPIIHRKRYIPDEVVDITGDELVYRDEDLLITRWKPIRERSDISGGISYTFLKEGYKISKFIGPSGEFIYWYCDIINVVYDKEQDKYVLVDLILDVKISPEGAIEILDADELADALDKGIITKEEACKSLRILDKILKKAYEGQFPPEICMRE